jgi:hypothetical protein
MGVAFVLLLDVLDGERRLTVEQESALTHTDPSASDIAMTAEGSPAQLSIP